MSNSNEVLNAYAVFFKTWPSKFVGEKPTAEMLDQYHKLGARHGKQCLAGAMALRDGGVTGAEIVMACGAPQLNKMRGYITDAFVKRLPDAGSRNGHLVYKLVLTPKGLQRVKQSEAKAAKLEAAGKVEKVAKPKVVKAVGTVKRKPKAKVTPVETPTVDAAPVTEMHADNVQA